MYIPVEEDGKWKHIISCECGSKSVVVTDKLIAEYVMCPECGSANLNDLSTVSIHTVTKNEEECMFFGEVIARRLAEYIDKLQGNKTKFGNMSIMLRVRFNDYGKIISEETFKVSGSVGNGSVGGIVIDGCPF